MSSARKPLLVTSTNPFSNLPFQIRCFDRWKSLGFDVQTVNVREEAKRLRAHGIESEDIRLIDDADSGFELFGKPVPRIKPLLESLANDESHDCYIISNSDIYPAVRSASVAQFWERCNSALALTREECHALEAHAFPDRSPYRGGLDAFFMTQGALKRVTSQLSKLEAAYRMAFGIPGWDYLMGACLLSPNVNGAILDSRTLLHVSHRPSYETMDEFRHYVTDMVNMGAVAGDDPSAAADEFSRRIDAECEKNQRLSRMARLIYFKSPPMEHSFEPETDEWRQVLTKLEQLAPQLENHYRVTAVRSLAARLAPGANGHVGMAFSFFVDSPSRLFQFAQTLFAIAFALHCKYQSRGAAFLSKYPPNSRHAHGLESILKHYPESDPQCRVEIASLFGAELVDAGIFNTRLFNYLALNCENDTERGLLGEIRSFRRSERDVA